MGSLNSRMHLHSLIFCSNSTTYRNVTSKWPHGYSNAKLANPDAIKYVTKYVTKSHISRIMASQNLGYYPHTEPNMPLWYKNKLDQKWPEWGDTVVSPEQQEGYRSEEVNL
jgi:hypothetical protein